MNVLLVEENSLNQFLFKQTVAEISPGTSVKIACSSLEARNLFRSSHTLPDIIFMDFNMPVMPGIECLIEIARYPKFKKIPVVVVSAVDYHVDVAKKLGAKGYIQKPDTADSFKEKINRVLNYNFNGTSDFSYQDRMLVL